MSAPQAVPVDFPIRIRELQVLRRVAVTPRMTRLTLGGPGIDGFESHLPDEHCKLVFPDPDTGSTRVPVQDDDHLDWPSPFPPTREYTVRRFDEVAGEVDVDVVLHDGGVGSTWAQSAEIGSSVWVAGPRPGVRVPPEFGFHVLLGDETALPAISRWLEELPDDARGVAAVEVADVGEEQPLRVPAGVSLTWLHRDGAAPGTTSLLGDFSRGVEPPEGVHTYVWAHGEAGCLKPVRRWARGHGIGKEQSAIGGYWRRGRENAVPTTVLGRLRAELGHLVDRD